MELLFFVVGVVFVIGIYEVVCLYKRNKQKKLCNTNIIMPEHKKEPIVITTPYVVKTHTDADGAGPAIIAKYYLGSENVTVFPTSNALMDKTIREIMEWEFACPETTVFITDISCSLETAKLLEEWLQNHPNVSIVLLDHHKTALALNEVSFCNVKVEKDKDSLQILDNPKDDDFGLSCGTSLFYEYVTQVFGYERDIHVEKITKIINAYDTWMWKTHLGGDETYKKWASDYFNLLGFDCFVETVLNKISLGKMEFDATDEALFEVDRARSARYVERKKRQCFFRKWEGYDTCFVSIDDYVADVADMVFETYEGVEVLAMVFPTGTISLRTRKEGVDVAAIAKKYGGGGHTQAAGFNLPKDKMQILYWLV